jgi:alkanesulfonate monooxygenase SsuD/methylene tetrahydromethanopterin reductase-like flavin-dependent oxidoreductase (luciferase family)
MFIGHFTEEPWQDPNWKEEWGSGIFTVSNSLYDPQIATKLYHRYLDEKVYAEEMGFDGLMLNEHHSAPFCMQGVTNVQAAILARITKKVKILLLGNILPIHENPLYLAEQLAMIDVISHGRLIPGFVRGGGSESIAQNAPPHYNRERFQEAHDFIIKTWTTPGPFRWEGKHYHYRYVNPWSVPLQKPHPPVWIPGTASRETVIWAAQHRYPYIMLSTQMEPTRQMFQLYRDTAAELGYEAGPQNLGYMFWLHVEETEEKAVEVGRKLTQGVRAPYDPGSLQAAPWLMSPPGMTSHDARTRTRAMAAIDASGRPHAGARASFEDQVANAGMIVGTPATVVPKIRNILEYLRPGTIIFRTGDGAMTHEEQMRTLKLMGQEVMPALREIGKELGLLGPEEISPTTGQRAPVLA